MTIEPIYGKYGAKMVTCDNCGTGFEADNWDVARAQMKDEGWRTRRVDGEWAHFCDECQEVEGGEK